MIFGYSKPAKQVCPPPCGNHTANPRASGENKRLDVGGCSEESILKS